MSLSFPDDDGDYIIDDDDIIDAIHLDNPEEYEMDDEVEWGSTIRFHNDHESTEITDFQNITIYADQDHFQDVYGQIDSLIVAHLMGHYLDDGEFDNDDFSRSYRALIDTLTNDKRFALEELKTKRNKAIMLEEFKYHPKSVGRLFEDHGQEGAFEILGF
jgi:hypothetical protein